jgi:hypothetical protein
LREAKHNARKYGLVSTNNAGPTFIWKYLPTEESFKLQYSMPAINTTDFFLLDDYRGGNDGRVWLACSKSGRLVVIKLSKDRGYEIEKNMWHKIWGCDDVRVISLLDAHALLMPFTFHALSKRDENGIQKITFKPLSHWNAHIHEPIERILDSDVTDKLDIDQFQRWYDDPWEVAKVAITEMAAKGYKHNDLCWRHVALLPISSVDNKDLWVVKPVLIDLHDVIELNHDVNLQCVIEESLQCLRNEISVC